MHIMFRMYMIVIMALIIRTAVASESAQPVGVPVVDTQYAGGSLPLVPEWREHATIRHDIVPPPPPGPYMSTALTPMPGVYHAESGYEQSMGTEMANSPFSTPDEMHWPNETSQPTYRWLPENGQYEYAPDKLLEQQQRLDTGYRKYDPPIQPSRANTQQPVYNYSQPYNERRRAYTGGSVPGGN
jgi:hypothetical protein